MSMFDRLRNPQTQIDWQHIQREARRSSNRIRGCMKHLWDSLPDEEKKAAYAERMSLQETDGRKGYSINAELLDHLIDLGIEVPWAEGENRMEEMRKEAAAALDNEQLDAAAEHVDEDEICDDIVLHEYKAEPSAWPAWLGVAAGVACIGLAVNLLRR